MRWMLIALLFLPSLAAQTGAVTLGAGLQSPANNVSQGQTNVVTLGFLVGQTAGTTAVNFTGCTISNVAPSQAAGATDTVRVRLIRDDDMNFAVSASDTVAATAVSPTFPVTLSGFSQAIPAATASTFAIWMIAVDIEVGSQVGNRYRIELTSVTTTATSTSHTPFAGNDQTIVAPSTAEMDLRRYSISKPLGSTDVVGGLQVNFASSVTWTIHNSGVSPLSISSAFVVSSSLFNCSASVTTPPAGTVAVNGSTSVTLSITPNALGQQFGFIFAINNNDADENPYSIVVAGLATPGPGPATQLVVTTQPGNGVAGMALAAQPIVQARDAGGQLDASFTGQVTAAIATGTGTPGAALTGTASINAVAGVATFAGLGVDLAGSGYELTFSNATLAQARSAAFNVTAAPATQLVVTLQPGGAIENLPLAPQPVIEARSAAGVLDPNFTGMVTAGITPTTGTPGAGLFGTLSVMAVAGVATFTDLSIDLAGTGYTLVFSSGALTTASSAAFDIQSSAATLLAVDVQPGNSTGGVAPASQPVIEARNIGGFVDTNFVGNVQAAITTGTGTAGATLSGTMTVAAVAGVATFTDLSIDLAGTGYTLTFTSGALTLAVSNPFDITVGPGVALRLMTQPGAANAGAVIPQQPVVAVEDAGGNLLLTDNTTQVSAAIATGTGGAVLSGASTLTVTAGVATFTDLAINLAGTYTLEFTATGLTTATSTPFVIASTGGGPGPGNGSNGSSAGDSTCVAAPGAGFGLFALLPLLWRRRRA